MTSWRWNGRAEEIEAGAPNEGNAMTDGEGRALNGGISGADDPAGSEGSEGSAARPRRAPRIDGTRSFLCIALVIALAELFAPTGLVLERGALLHGLVGSYQDVVGDYSGSVPGSSNPNSSCPSGCNEGPGAGEPVDLARGFEEYNPRPDLEVYNPFGLPVSYQRSFSTVQAAGGYSSSGLSTGWTDNYDYAIVVDDSSHTFLLYPNGAAEEWTPSASTGSPVTFTNPNFGLQYVATGVASVANAWTTASITWKDGTQWTFDQKTTTPHDVLLLDTITPVTGTPIRIVRSASAPFQITAIQDTNPTTLAHADLLDLSMSGSPLVLTQIQDVSDPNPRTIHYGLDTNSRLWKVSKINAAVTDPHWTYTYTLVSGEWRSVQAATGSSLGGTTTGLWRRWASTPLGK